MPRKTRRTKPNVRVKQEDSFDLANLPAPGESLASVFSLRLDAKTLAMIDRARELYAVRIAAAVRRTTVPLETRSKMIRILIEDGLRHQGVIPPDEPAKGGIK